MPKKKDHHLAFDVDFLEDNSRERKSKSVFLEKSDQNTTPDHYNQAQKSKGNNSKVFLWLLGIVGLFTIVGSLIDNESTKNPSSNSPPSGYTTPVSASPSASASEILKGDGQYSCSLEHSLASDGLLPTSSKTDLDAETDKLNARITANKAMGKELDSYNVNSFNQKQINLYNKAVDDFNAELTSIKQEAVLHENKVNQFNSKIDAYNEYLQKNCTKRF